MIKAIVTDCFGVVYNDILIDMLAHHDIDPEIRSACFKLARSSDLGEMTLDEFFEAITRRTSLTLETVRSEMFDTSKLNRELVDILTRLRSTYKIGMITNVHASLFTPFLANENVRSRFDKIVISSEVKYIKPQRQIFEIMNQELGVKSSEVIFIDNSTTNTQAARELGMKTIIFTNNGSLRDSLRSLIPSSI